MPVLVGFVPTPEGKAALRRAVLECHLRETRLIVVSAEHGADVPTPSHPLEPPDSSAGEVQAICADLGVSQPEVEFRRNRNAYEPADDVLSVAEETEAELIVIGLRRRTAVGKLILGGSAQRILLDASCPVLAVKADQRTGWAGAVLSTDGFTLSTDGDGGRVVEPEGADGTAGHNVTESSTPVQGTADGATSMATTSGSEGR